MAADSEFTDLTRRLCCLRGVSTLTGFALAVEIAEWDRFTGSSIGSYLGLVPTEHSSGGSRRQGGITKTGNSHARRLLIEAAWHHKPRYVVGKVLQARWEQAPQHARVRAHLGNQRLHQRWAGYTARHKKHTVANTAIARELAGWCWSLATLETLGLAGSHRLGLVDDPDEQREETIRDSAVSHEHPARDARPQTRGTLLPNTVQR